jgi:tetratricopeptide (TPR) repeat protein
MMTEQNLLAELCRIRERAQASDPRLIDPLRRLAAWYCEQRQPHRARPLVHELWTLHRLKSGETDPLTVNTASWLASILVSGGKPDRAEALLEQLVIRLRQDQALELGQRAAIWNQLVEIYYQRSKLTESLETCREVLALLGKRSTRRDPGCVSQWNRARNNLGALHVARGEYPEAQRVFVRNLRDARRRLPTGDLSLVAQLSNLATVMRLRGQIFRSERLTVSAIRQCQRATGWYHPLVAQGMSNLGAYRLQGGRPGSARSLFRKALKIRRRLHPAGHPQISRTLRQLAEAYLALGKHSAAERLLERTRIRLEQQAPLDEQQLAQTLCSLGFVYLGAGRLANCERTLDRALQLQERILGPENSQLIQTLNGLGCLNTARANHEAADAFHDRALKLAEQHLGSNHPELAKTLIWLGEVALARGEVKQAQIVVDRALSIRELSLGAEHPLVAEVLVRCGHVALALEQPARALSIGARAKAIYAKSPECLPLALADVLAVAAEASRRLRRYRGAEKLSLEELKLREQVVGAEHVTLLPAIKRLAWSYLERDMLPEADPTLRRGLAISEKTLGSLHEEGIHFTESLGRMSLARQDFAEAGRWMDRTIRMCQRQYGDDAEEVANTLLKFAGCLRTARRETDADAYERRAIDLRNRNCHVLL